MRFLVFVYSDYYPRGGWNDFIDCRNTLEEAKQLSEDRLAVGPEYISESTRCRQHEEFLIVRASKGDWAQIVDTLTLTVFELASPDGYCPSCGNRPEYPRWSHQVSSGTEPGNSGTDPLNKEQHNV